MRPKPMPKLTLSEWTDLMILAARIEKEVDTTLADLIRRVAAGDDTALVPAVDRLKELGRDEQAEQLKKLLTD